LYKERFFTTHVRINLDMLKTRHRERRLLAVCLELQQPFVVDNTNTTLAEREVYISYAKESSFRVVGYYLQSKVEDCHRRNLQRPPAQQIPLKGVLGTAGRLVRPSFAEGFDELHYVRIGDDGTFIIEEWKDEVR
jgi:hypothetical protein